METVDTFVGSTRLRFPKDRLEEVMAKFAKGYESEYRRYRRRLRERAPSPSQNAARWWWTTRGEKEARGYLEGLRLVSSDSEILEAARSAAAEALSLLKTASLSDTPALAGEWSKQLKFIDIIERRGQ